MTKKIVSIYCLCVFMFLSLFFISSKSVFAEEDFEVNAKACVLVDFNSGEILSQKNPTEHLEVASIVKLMTILLTLEKIQNQEISLSDVMTVSQNAADMGGSQVFIDVNGKYTVEEMLKSVIVASANDASVALAEFIAGSENNFVGFMNKKAQELGMTNTLYANATGLHAPNQYSCAIDTAKLLGEVISYDLYHNYSTIWIDTLKHNTGRETELVNTNKLIRYYQGCDGGKTGFTDEAGYCLASSVKRDDMRLVSVVLGTKSKNDRFNESAKLFNFGFSNFVNEQILSTDKILGEIEVLKCASNKCEIVAKENFFAVVKKGCENPYTYVLNVDKNTVAPKNIGDKVGNVSILKNGKVVKEIDVVLNQNLEKITYKQAIEKLVEKF